jgi:hypothetical protein
MVQLLANAAIRHFSLQAHSPGAVRDACCNGFFIIWSYSVSYAHEILFDISLGGVSDVGRHGVGVIELLFIV